MTEQVSTTDVEDDDDTEPVSTHDATVLDPTPNTAYIVGRPFQSPEGWHWPGEPVPEDVAVNTNLYALISSGFIYPYVPDKGYAYLPPHVYSAVRTYQETMDVIKRGEAPIEMDWTPPAKLKQAMDVVDAENASRRANQVTTRTSTEDWTRKLEISQISPRPVELPREKLFVDSRKSEAEEAAEDDEDTGSGSGSNANAVAPEDESDEDRSLRLAEKVNKDFKPTPQYSASEENPLRPEFEDSDLQDSFETSQPDTTPKTPEEVEEDMSENRPPEYISDTGQEFGTPVYEPVALSQEEAIAEAEKMAEESEKVAEEQAEDVGPVIDPDVDTTKGKDKEGDVVDPIAEGEKMAEESAKVAEEQAAQPNPHSDVEVEDEGGRGSTEDTNSGNTEAPEDEEVQPYTEWTNVELQDELKARDLPTSGNKAELVSRLEDNDEGK